MDTIHWQGTLSNVVIGLVPRIHERGGGSHIPDHVDLVPLLQEISDVNPGITGRKPYHRSR
jgi:hypothetical protein